MSVSISVFLVGGLAMVGVNLVEGDVGHLKM